MVNTGEYRYVSLPGIQVYDAMKNLNCDWPAFKKIVFTFYKNRSNSREEIATLMARGALNEVREIAHGIRGGSGYVGAWKLHQEAVALEEACKTGDIDVAKEHIPSIFLSLDEVIGGLEGLCGSGSIK